VSQKNCFKKFVMCLSSHYLNSAKKHRTSEGRKHEATIFQLSPTHPLKAIIRRTVFEDLGIPHCKHPKHLSKEERKKPRSHSHLFLADSKTPKLHHCVLFRGRWSFSPMLAARRCGSRSRSHALTRQPGRPSSSVQP